MKNKYFIDIITVDRYTLYKGSDRVTINELMKEKNITKYRLSKNSGIPYTTINDICNGKALLEKCTAETIYRIAKTLGVTMEDLLEPYISEQIDFELYKSNVCHRVKELGDVDFIIETLEKNDIRTFYRRKRYAESFYLLAMLDYLSRVNDVPLCTEYDDLRQCKLRDPLYPTGILTASAVNKDESIKEQAKLEAIPEFMQFNIVENEVRDVI